MRRIVEPKLKPNEYGYFKVTNNYLYEKYASAIPRRKDRVSKSIHGKIIKAFHNKILNLMVEKLHVYKMPFNLGELCVGEEVNKRKRIKKYIVDENGKSNIHFYDNSAESNRIFRIWWNKQTCNFENDSLYLNYNQKPARVKLGIYAEEQNKNILAKDYRAYPILRN